MQALLLLSTLFFTTGLGRPFVVNAPQPSDLVSRAVVSTDVGKLVSVVHAAANTNDVETLAKQLLTIAPGTANCDGAKYPNECRNATQAAQPILCSFSKYQVSNANEQAALISLMMYESGEFKYNWGHFVSGQTVHTPGKGTRNMQSADYNEKYARSLFSSDKVDQAKSNGGADGVLELVSPDEPSFGSAAWFLTSQCDSSVRSGLQAGTQAGFEQYVTGCIQTTVDQSRIDYWTKAKAALAG